MNFQGWTGAKPTLRGFVFVPWRIGMIEQGRLGGCDLLFKIKEPKTDMNPTYATILPTN